MMKILIVAPYCSLPGDMRFNRFLSMAEMLAKSGYAVTLVTSVFMHHEKKFRTKTVFDEKFEIKLLMERGYSTNLSLKRVLSIYDFTRSFNKWFDKNNKFDLVISAYPLISTNISIVRKKRKYDFKFLLDIQDVWPESIASALPLFRYFPRKLMPFTRQANTVYRSADAIVAVSSTYLERALEVAESVPSGVIYIGSNFDAIDQAVPRVFSSEKIRMFYIGSLGPSYDIETAIRACNRLRKEGANVELHILGVGKELEHFKRIAEEAVVFHGQVSYREMFEIIKSCDIALNALSSNATQSVTNKLSDYLSLGCPIMNSSKNKEVVQLLKGKNVSHYEAGSVESYCSAFHAIVPRIGERWIPDRRFNRKEAYLALVRMVELLVKQP